MKPSHICESEGHVEYCIGERRMAMPIVEGRPTRRGDGLEVHCPYCGKRHLHSLHEGTRIAQCRKPEKGDLFAAQYYVRPRGARGAYVSYGELARPAQR